MTLTIVTVQKIHIGLYTILGICSFVPDAMLIGLLILAAYGVAALLWQLPSTAAYQLALVLLLGAGIMAILAPYSELGDTWAAYAYASLAIGATTAAVEHCRPKIDKRKIV